MEGIVGVLIGGVMWKIIKMGIILYILKDKKGGHTDNKEYFCPTSLNYFKDRVIKEDATPDMLPIASIPLGSIISKRYVVMKHRKISEGNESGTRIGKMSPAMREAINKAAKELVDKKMPRNINHYYVGEEE
jgi:hypothetical protein